ncbi:MAG: RHS repeat-associated core domain-containing protein [Bacteroidia bacterium]
MNYIVSRGSENLLRFGFNGHEKVDEISGAGKYMDFGARMYDNRIGRFLTIDPDCEKFASTSPYVFTYNNPIFFIDKNGRTGVASIEGNTIVVRATIYYYGDIKLPEAQDMTNQIQNTCNRVHHEDGTIGLGVVEIEGRSYNVRFEIAAEVITRSENQTDEQYFFEVGNFIGGIDNKTHDVRSNDPKNNFVRVGPSTTTSPVSNYSGDGGYFVKSETGIFSTTPTHEIWHGFQALNTFVHILNQTPNGLPNISSGDRPDINPNERVVTQYDIFQLKLDKILCNGNTTGVVGGVAGNKIYDENGYGTPSVVQGEVPTNNENCE